MIWGHGKSIKKGNEFMAHKCGFTKKTLMNALTEAGFKSVAGVEVPEHFELWAIAQKNKVVCYTAYNHRFEPNIIKMKRLILIVLFLSLYSCTAIDGNRIAPGYVEAFKSLRNVFFGYEQNIDPELIEKIPYASISPK